jgi:hypothetical protein
LWNYPNQIYIGKFLIENYFISWLHKFLSFVSILTILLLSIEFSEKFSIKLVTYSFFVIFSELFNKSKESINFGLEKSLFFFLMICLIFFIYSGLIVFIKLIKYSLFYIVYLLFSPNFLHNFSISSRFTYLLNSISFFTIFNS